MARLQRADPVRRWGRLSDDADLTAIAQRLVLFVNFIFAGDATGRRFAGALCDASQCGVELRVPCCAIGMMAAPRTAETSRARALPVDTFQ